MNRPIIIGLTGPTGAGKSTAAKAFAALGAGVIDCDRLGRELLDMEPCRKALCEAYGTVILDETGRISRPKLAEQAFARAGGSERLNQITHPLIIEEVLQQAKTYEEAGAKAVIVDAALLFESGASSLCDKRLPLRQMKTSDCIALCSGTASQKSRQKRACVRRSRQSFTKSVLIFVWTGEESLRACFSRLKNCSAC